MVIVTTVVVMVYLGLLLGVGTEGVRWTVQVVLCLRSTTGEQERRGHVRVD